MKRFLSLVLAAVMLVFGCTSGVSESEQSKNATFNGLNDPALLSYVEDAMTAEIAASFDSDDYIVEDVSAVYISQEYLDGLAYNSQMNVFYGYTLADIDAQFSGTRYIFTLGDNKETVVQPFEAYDDTYEKVLRNVAIGTGVILICVTVSVVTAGAGVPAVSMVFAAAAKTGTSFALSSGAISAAAAGIVTGYQTGDFDQALKAAALSGSEGFKWGAITGAVAGGTRQAIALHKAAVAASKGEQAASTVPTWRESEQEIAKAYNGESQCSYLSGKEVPYGTAGATRPDFVYEGGGGKVAVEVKNYTLDNAQSVSALKQELHRQVEQRVKELPSNFTQEIVLDVRGRNYAPGVVENVISDIREFLMDVYPNIPIETYGL